MEEMQQWGQSTLATWEAQPWPHGTRGATLTNTSISRCSSVASKSSSLAAKVITGGSSLARWLTWPPRLTTSTQIQAQLSSEKQSQCQTESPDRAATK